MSMAEDTRKRPDFSSDNPSNPARESANDPLAELARLIFHELAHQLLYVKDDTSFNESFATAVEEAGVARWLAALPVEANSGDIYARLPAN